MTHQFCFRIGDERPKAGDAALLDGAVDLDGVGQELDGLNDACLGQIGLERLADVAELREVERGPEREEEVLKPHDGVTQQLVQGLVGVAGPDDLVDLANHFRLHLNSVTLEKQKALSATQFFVAQACH